MKTEDLPEAYEPWTPTTNSKDVKILGKLGEELGECQSAVMRCLIQGIDEMNPETGVSNRRWLEDEIADVMACMDLACENYNLNWTRILQRLMKKKKLMEQWHNAGN